MMGARGFDVSGETVANCPLCGAALPADAAFCGLCGMPGPPATTPKRVVPTWVWIVVPAVVLGIIVGVVFAMNQPKGSATSVSSTTAHPVTQAAPLPTGVPSSSAAATTAVQPSAATPATSGSSTYANSRFGYEGFAPPSWGRTEFANGDGVVFSDGAGSSLTYGGQNLVLHETSGEIHAAAISRFEAAGGRVTYKVGTASLSVVSGFAANGDIVYSYCRIGTASTNTMRWVYPARATAQGKAWVEQSVSSFHPGDLAVAH